MKEKFLKELKELLTKYSAEISFKCGDGSDTHGLYDERIEISDKNGNEFITSWGYWLTASDIPE